MGAQLPPVNGPGQPGLGEPAPRLELSHQLPAPGEVVHFVLHGPAGGQAFVILTRPDETAKAPGS